MNNHDKLINSPVVMLFNILMEDLECIYVDIVLSGRLKSKDYHGSAGLTLVY